MNTEIERQLPHSPEAERGILGAFLVGNLKAPAVIDRLTAEDFHVAQNHHVFSAIQKLFEADKPIDLLSVHEALIQAGKLEAAGGIEYVAQLGDMVPRVGSLEFYVRTIRAKAIRRQVIHAARAIYESGFDVANAEDAVLDRGIERLSEIARSLDADQDFGTTYQSAAARLLSEFDAREGVRIFTGIDELDRLTGGFRAGELVLFTAETGVGKTLLAQQTRRRSCQENRHTLFCSGEMRATQLRCYSFVRPVPTWPRRPLRFCFAPLLPVAG